MKQITANVNPQVFLGRMLREIGGHMGDFRNALRTIEDNSFIARAQEHGPNTTIHIETSDALLGKDASTQRAIDNCFLAMARSLVTLVDWTLGLKLASTKHISDLPVGTPVGELGPFVDKFLETCYSEIAQNVSLTNPKKIAMLDGLPAAVSSSMRSINTVRRVLEHHGGKSNKDIRLILHKTILSIGGQELTNLPMYVEKDTELRIQIIQEETLFAANNRICLSEQNIENMALTLQSIIGPAVVHTLSYKSAEE